MSQTGLVKIPQDAEAEREVIGRCLMNSTWLNAAAEYVRPEDFFHTANRKLFSAMLKLQSEGREVCAEQRAVQEG